MKKTITVLLLVILSGFLYTQDLEVDPEDIVITQEINSGYHLWIRQKDDIASVLLTEPTENLIKKDPVYSLRNPEYHSLNGDEMRILNNKFLDPEKKLYSLIDSTTEIHRDLGDSFHIFIPNIAVYGYPWSRSGELQIRDGTFLNLRTFPRPFADYSDGFKDNPFVLRIVQKSLPLSEAYYIEDIIHDFQEIAELGGGKSMLSTGEDDILDKIEDLLNDAGGGSLDLVLVLDTTNSMKNYISRLRTSLVPLLEEISSRYSELRFGIVLYKDYMEQYTTKVFPFSKDISFAQNVLDTVRAFGGRDIPDAVYEALYAGIHGFSWKAQKRKIILVGDAPPHREPRGNITKETVFVDAQHYAVELHTIILPQ